MNPQPSFTERLFSGLDTALKTLTPGAMHAKNANPAAELSEPDLSAEQKKHIGGLMRVNHCGEVCAQALYQGQALTARHDKIQQQMTAAADEERDHLAWCESRLQELGTQPSLLNPLFYGLSFTLGALAGAAGDRYSLGFVAATEQQVSEHLQRHLDDIGATDAKSSAIIATMLEDEARHASQAQQAGGLNFPGVVKKLMTLTSAVMTKSTYRL